MVLTIILPSCHTFPHKVSRRHHLVHNKCNDIMLGSLQYMYKPIVPTEGSSYSSTPATMVTGALKNV